MKKNREIYPVMETISKVEDEYGDAVNYIGIFFDISKEVQYQEKLEYIAHYDPLTGLLNRALFVDRVTSAMKTGIRSGKIITIIYIDIDDFKSINDRYGHETGDALLPQIGKRFQKYLRSEDSVARFGGDEFVILMPGLATEEDSEPVISKIASVFEQPYVIDSHVIKVSASFGITFYPQKHSVTPEQLIRQADQAMYQAKLSGKNTFAIFDLKMEKMFKSRQNHIKKVKEAYQKNEFTLYYQPKVILETGKIFGAEALIRWISKDGHIVMPDQFLPHIESDKFFIELSEWVITTALKELQVFLDIDASLKVSVNLPPMQIENTDFMERLKALLSPYQKEYISHLEFEILESSAINNLQRIVNIINQCKKLGIDFSLDDFGVGYASISYLQKLPLKFIKIDKSFVLGLTANPFNLMLVKTVIMLAKMIDAQVIAEGVETKEHYQLLRKLGCHMAQGYFMAKPMPLAQFQSWYGNWVPLPPEA